MSFLLNKLGFIFVFDVNNQSALIALREAS